MEELKEKCYTSNQLCEDEILETNKRDNTKENLLEVVEGSELLKIETGVPSKSKTKIYLKHDDSKASYEDVENLKENKENKLIIKGATDLLSISHALTSDGFSELTIERDKTKANENEVAKLDMIQDFIKSDDFYNMLDNYITFEKMVTAIKDFIKKEEIDGLITEYVYTKQESDNRYEHKFANRIMTEDNEVKDLNDYLYPATYYINDNAKLENAPEQGEKGGFLIVKGNRDGEDNTNFYVYMQMYIDIEYNYVYVRYKNNLTDFTNWIKLNKVGDGSSGGNLEDYFTKEEIENIFIKKTELKNYVLKEDYDSFVTDMSTVVKADELEDFLSEFVNIDELKNYVKLADFNNYSEETNSKIALLEQALSLFYGKEQADLLFLKKDEAKTLYPLKTEYTMNINNLSSAINSNNEQIATNKQKITQLEKKIGLLSTQMIIPNMYWADVIGLPSQPFVEIYEGYVILWGSFTNAAQTKTIMKITYTSNFWDFGLSSSVPRFGQSFVTGSDNTTMKIYDDDGILTIKPLGGTNKVEWVDLTGVMLPYTYSL